MIFDLLVEYITSLPSGAETLHAVYGDLHQLISANLTSNRICIPTITTCSKLTEALVTIQSMSSGNEALTAR